MPQNDIEKAFNTLVEMLGGVGTDINSEVSSLEQKIEALRGRIVELKSKQDTLAHDRATIQEMYNKYSNQINSATDTVF